MRDFFTPSSPHRRTLRNPTHSERPSGRSCLTDNEVLINASVYPPLYQSFICIIRNATGRILRAKRSRAIRDDRKAIPTLFSRCSLLRLEQSFHSSVLVLVLVTRFSISSRSLARNFPREITKGSSSSCSVMVNGAKIGATSRTI